MRPHDVLLGGVRIYELNLNEYELMRLSTLRLIIASKIKSLKNGRFYFMQPDRQCLLGLPVHPNMETDTQFMGTSIFIERVPTGIVIPQLSRSLPSYGQQMFKRRCVLIWEGGDGIGAICATSGSTLDVVRALAIQFCLLVQGHDWSFLRQLNGTWVEIQHEQERQHKLGSVIQGFGDVLRIRAATSSQYEHPSIVKSSIVRNWTRVLKRLRSGAFL